MPEAAEGAVVWNVQESGLQAMVTDGVSWARETEMIMWSQAPALDHQVGSGAPPDTEWAGAGLNLCVCTNVCVCV